MTAVTRSMLVGVAATLLTGCSTFTAPMEKPIIEDHSHDRRVTTFATIPSRRLVIMSSEGEKTGAIFVCAEPSADVSDNLASSLSAAISGKGPSGADAAEVAASIAKTLETTAQLLSKRSQGLQLYRDGMYNLCQARMNGVIKDELFIARSSDLLDRAEKLIHAEIPYLGNAQLTSTAAPNHGVSARSTASVGSASTNTSTNDSAGVSK
jgi:hypothetical protein